MYTTIITSGDKWRDDVLGIERQSFQQPMTAEQLDKYLRLRAGAFLTVAIRNHVCVGYLLSRTSGDPAEHYKLIIDRVGVLQDCRRQGIGLHLVGWAITACPEREHYVEARGTGPLADKFLPACGFARIGEKTESSILAKITGMPRKTTIYRVRVGRRCGAETGVE